MISLANPYRSYWLTGIRFSDRYRAQGPTRVFNSLVEFRFHTADEKVRFLQDPPTLTISMTYHTLSDLVELVETVHSDWEVIYIVHIEAARYELRCRHKDNPEMRDIVTVDDGEIISERCSDTGIKHTHEKET